MEKKLLEHINLLKEKVFQIETKWPQFKLLLNDIINITNDLEHEKNIISLERNHLYGGFSLFAPVFKYQNFISIDCSPSSAEERGAYNKDMVDDPRFIKIPTKYRFDIESIDLDSNIADMILVPNLIHHIKNQSKMFEEFGRLLKKGGSVYIFEPLVREIHQAPDDFVRYTPHGLEEELRKKGFSNFKTNTEGGPFQVISYCWSQALQYIPKKDRKEIKNWYEDKHFKFLMDLDKKYKNNLDRKFTTFPASYSLLAKKV